jgi:hypothetical protein
LIFGKFKKINPDQISYTYTCYVWLHPKNKICRTKLFIIFEYSYRLSIIKISLIRTRFKIRFMFSVCRDFFASGSEIDKFKENEFLFLFAKQFLVVYN